jgi:hypothetical protein
MSLFSTVSPSFPSIEAIDKSLTPEQRRLLHQYKENIDAYEGYHFENKVPKTVNGELQYDDGAEVTINFIRRFVEKLVRFTVGDVGFVLDMRNQDYQKTVLKYVDDIWDKNRRLTIASSMLKWGSILGDVYLVLEPSKRMLAEKLKDRKQAERIEASLTVEEMLEPDFLIKVYPATNSFPYYREDKTGPFSEMIMFEYKEVRPKPPKKIQKVYPDKSPAERAFMRYADYLENRAGKDDDTSEHYYLYKKVYYPDRIEEYADDKLLAKYQLDYGLVTVVHIPNKIKSSNTPYGDDDISDIIPINYELNYKASDVSEIINYYQSPLTIFFGVGLETIEKGSDRILTGLPENAKVQNLEMKGDLAASQNYINFLKSSMLELFGITPTSLQGNGNISNTSGVALHMQYEPLLERKQEKGTYLDGICKLNTYLIYLAIFYQRIPGISFGNPRDALRQKPDMFETIAMFPDTLPKDELLIIQKGNSKIQSGLGTREDVLRELGEVNPTRKLQEIQKDQLEIMKLNLMKSLLDNIAKQGVNPQVLSTLDSLSKSTAKDGDSIETNFATGFLNDPILQALLKMSINDDRIDEAQKAELEARTGTKEMKRVAGKVQSIV